MFDVAAVFDSDESGESLGSRLAAARKARNLPIEKAAHDTRIRVQRLREIEHDDFSQFSHPSYARMFLTDYARYLGLEVEVIKPLLPAPGACGAAGYQYLEEGPRTYVRKKIRPARQRRLITGLIVAAVVILLLAFAIPFAIKLQRLGPLDRVAKDQIVKDDRSLIVEPSTPSAPVPEPAEVPAAPAPEPAAAAPVQSSATESVPANTPPLFVGGTVSHGNAVQ